MSVRALSRRPVAWGALVVAALIIVAGAVWRVARPSSGARPTDPGPQPGQVERAGHGAPAPDASTIAAELFSAVASSPGFLELTSQQQSAFLRQVADVIHVNWAESPDSAIRLVESWGGRLSREDEARRELERVSRVTDPTYRVRAYRVDRASLRRPEVKIDADGIRVETLPDRYPGGLTGVQPSLFGFDDPSRAPDAPRLMLEIPLSVPGRRQDPYLTLWFRWSESLGIWAPERLQVQVLGDESLIVPPVF